MSTNSIRISAQTFEMARAQGELMSRSAAQQVEHWARLGAALEASGMTVPAALALLKGPAEEQVPEAELWAFKRQQQARDLQAVRSGKASPQDMSWFSGDGRARKVELKDSPY